MEFYTCIHLCAVEYVHLKYTKLSLHYACVHNSPLKKKKDQEEQRVRIKRRRE